MTALIPKVISKNRANRAHLDALATPRLLLRALTAVAPAAAAAFAEKIYLSPPRPRRPEWEVELLMSATRGEVIVDGEPIPTWSWGAGPTVMLVHGLSGRGSQLGKFVAPLTAAGFRVVAFDGPGHGDAPGRRGSLVTQTRAIIGVASALSHVHSVVAHSGGATASMLAATWAPIQVGRFVLLAPAASPTQFVERFGEMLALSPRVQDTMVRRIEARYAVSLADLEATRVASKLVSPALVIHDEDDREVQIADGRAIAAAWRGATFRATRGLGHRRLLRDDAVIEEVVAFVARDLS